MHSRIAVRPDGWLTDMNQTKEWSTPDRFLQLANFHVASVSQVATLRALAHEIPKPQPQARRKR